LADDKDPDQLGEDFILLIVREYTMKNFIQQYFNYVNDEKFDQLMELWHENGVFDVPFQGKIEGKTEIRKFYETLPKVYSRHEDNPIDFLFGGDKAAVRIEVTNITHEGKTIHFFAHSWMAFEQGKIKSIHALFDSVKVLKDMKG